MWALIAQFALAVGGSLMKSKQEAKQLEKDNESKAKANLANAIDTAATISTLQTQAGLFKTQAAAARTAAGRQALMGKGSAETQAASAGVRGSSVDAVISDIDRELGYANADLERNVDVEQFNMQTRLRSLISGSKANTYGFTPVADGSTQLSGALVQGALVAGSNYANSYFKYGKG
jgi:hypothetical protein